MKLFFESINNENPVTCNSMDDIDFSRPISSIVRYDEDRNGDWDKTAAILSDNGKYFTITYTSRTPGIGYEDEDLGNYRSAELAADKVFAFAGGPVEVWYDDVPQD